MKDSNLIKEKSFDFAVRIVNLAKYMRKDKKEHILSTQILKSGTSIGANIVEATEAQSKKDFISKLQISLKEAAETRYWLELLFKTDYISKESYQSMIGDTQELIKILNSIILSTKRNLQKNGI